MRIDGRLCHGQPPAQGSEGMNSTAVMPPVSRATNRAGRIAASSGVT